MSMSICIPAGSSGCSPTYRAGDEPIYAVYPQRRHLLPKVAALVDLLEAELANAMVLSGA